MPRFSEFPSYVPGRLVFPDGIAWGAIAGDRAPTFGSVDIVLDAPADSRAPCGQATCWLSFDFDFPGTRLDPAGLYAVDISVQGWQSERYALTRRIDTSRAPISNAPISIYGVESYDNSAGVEVQAAYWAVGDNY